MILAAKNWRTNADLIADVAELWIKPDDLVLDVTYGRGLWWTKYLPKNFLADDIAITGVDFRDLPYDDNRFDVVAYDPPYVAKGGRLTSGIAEFDARYGLKDCPRTPEDLTLYILEGMKEIHRVLKPGGRMLFKYKDYITSGNLHHVSWPALAIGFELVDRFEHIGHPGPQPKTNRNGTPRRQVHARRNVSTLLVLEKQ